MAKISGSFAKNDLQLKASYGSSPLCSSSPAHLLSVRDRVIWVLSILIINYSDHYSDLRPWRPCTHAYMFDICACVGCPILRFQRLVEFVTFKQLIEFATLRWHDKFVAFGWNTEFVTFWRPNWAQRDMQMPHYFRDISMTHWVRGSLTTSVICLCTEWYVDAL